MTSPLGSSGSPIPRFRALVGDHGPDRVEVRIGDDFVREVEVLEGSPHTAEKIASDAYLQRRLLRRLERDERLPDHSFTIRRHPDPMERVTFDLERDIDTILADLFKGHVGQHGHVEIFSEGEEGAAEAGESFLDAAELSMKLGEVLHGGAHHIHSGHSSIHAAHHATRPVAHGSEALTRASAAVGLVAGPIGAVLAFSELYKRWELEAESKRLRAEKDDLPAHPSPDEVARINREIDIVENELHEYSLLAIGLKGLAAAGGVTRATGELAGASEGLTAGFTAGLAGAGILLSAHSIRHENKRLGHLAEEERLLQGMNPVDCDDDGIDEILGPERGERRITWNQFKDYRISQVQQEIVESKWRRRRSWAFLAVSTVAFLGAVGVAATLFPGLALAGSISILVASVVVYSIRKPHLAKAYGARLITGTWWKAKAMMAWERSRFAGARLGNWYRERWGSDVKAAKIDHQRLADGRATEDQVQGSLRAVARNLLDWRERERLHAERMAELREGYAHIDESIERLQLRYTFQKGGPPEKVIRDFENFARNFVKQALAERNDPDLPQVFTSIVKEWGYSVEEFLPREDEASITRSTELVRTAFLEQRHKELSAVH